MQACPGCGLELPERGAVYAGYYHASPECWSVYGEVLAAEFQNPVLFGQVHQLTVDTYAVQHAGGRHPDKSVCVHLVGLHLVLEQRVPPAQVPPQLQRLVANSTSWPHFTPPDERVRHTVFDVASAGTAAEHAQRVHAWAAAVWSGWQAHHLEVDRFAQRAHR